MVEGCKKQKDVVVVDLDGTLIKGNSLHIFFKAALCDALRQNRYGFILIASSLLLLRRLKLVSHRLMKFAILNRIVVTDRLKADFVKKIERRRRQSVEHLLTNYRKENARIILATAAPDIYIPWIWDGDFVATKTYNNPARLECRGGAKLKALRNKFKDFDNRLLALFSDHHDDLPLFNLDADDIYLVEPSAQTLMTLSLANIKFSRIE